MAGEDPLKLTANLDTVFAGCEQFTHLSLRTCAPQPSLVGLSFGFRLVRYFSLAGLQPVGSSKDF